MTTHEQEQQVKRMAVALHRHRSALLGIPGCTGVAIGLKEAGGEPTRTLAITVFVAEKRRDVPPVERVPAAVEGWITDVVERPAPRPELIATDPFALHNPVFGGISVAPYETPPAWGSIGCFIYTTGNDAIGVPPGDYLLTCEHVLAIAGRPGNDPRVIQPMVEEVVPPAAYVCADYVYGFRTPALDCAIATLTNGRDFENEVPNYPWWPGRRDIEGIGAAVPGARVYKYGATSRFTRGIVRYVNYSPPGLEYVDTVLVDSEDGGIWVAKGDSGSVTIRQDDDYAIGLNFAGSPDHMLPPPPDYPVANVYSAGFAYDLRSQMDAFAGPGGVTGLA